MSERRDLAFVTAFDALCQAHGLTYDDALETLAAFFLQVADDEADAEVRAILQAAADHLRSAALHIYVSEK